MSASFQIRQAGLSVNNATNGESLDYYVQNTKTATITATVNRDENRGREFWLKAGEIDFDLRGVSEIEIKKTDFSGRPVVGNAFLDGFSTRHRIRNVTQTDVSWQCTCLMSPVTP